MMLTHEPTVGELDVFGWSIALDSENAICLLEILNAALSGACRRLLSTHERLDLRELDTTHAKPA